MFIQMDVAAKPRKKPFVVLFCSWRVCVCARAAQVFVGRNLAYCIDMPGIEYGTDALPAYIYACLDYYERLYLD